MSYLPNPARAASNSTGVPPPSTFANPAPLSRVRLVTSKPTPAFMSAFASMAAGSPVPMSSTFFLGSTPTFSSTILTATSPSEVTSSPISVVSLMRVAILMTYANSWSSRRPDSPSSLALDAACTISSYISGLPTTMESSPVASLSRFL